MGEVVNGVDDPNNIVGKFTFINRNFHWEIELFNHSVSKGWLYFLRVGY